MEATTASASSAATAANSSLSASQSIMTNSSRNSSSLDTNGFTNLTENHRSFIYSLLNEDDCLLLDNIFNYREKLFSEIKELEDELSDVQNEIEQIDVTDNDSKNHPKSKQISLGKKKFNIDPKQGMKFLLESNLIENTADSVAQFLFAGEGLNKIAIGIYLGEKEELNLQVLKKYIDLYDFQSKNLVESLREFLSNFQLPGESQKIDRIMEHFSERFCSCNPNILSPDACFIISFATVMLNTLLHNPSIKDRQTCDQFLKMCRDGCKDEEVPEQLLKDIYTSIKREQFKLVHNDASEFMLTFNNPIREGWLWKQGGRYKVWQRRWFILNDGCLYYFEFTSDKEPKGIIPLENVNVREVDDRTKQFCFEIYSTTNDKIKACKHDSEGKVVEVGNHAVYRMSATTAEDKNEWIKRIRDCISENPLLNTTSKRSVTGSSNKSTTNGLNATSSSNGNSGGNLAGFSNNTINESTLTSSATAATSGGGGATSAASATSK